VQRCSRPAGEPTLYFRPERLRLARAPGIHIGLTWRWLGRGRRSGLGRVRPRLRGLSGLDPVAPFPALCPTFRARAATAAAASATTPAPPAAPLPSLSPLSPLRPLARVGALVATGGPATAAAATASAAAACSALGAPPAPPASRSAVTAERLRYRRGGGELGRHQFDPRLEIRVHFDDPDLRDVGGRHAWPARTATEPGAA